MKLEVGKTYVNRAGKLCKIVKYSSDPDEVYPYMDDYGKEYTSIGTFYSAVKTDFDIVEEYKPSVQPLTIEQIQDMHSEANRGCCIEFEHYLKAVRDTERVHGIGVNLNVNL